METEAARAGLEQLKQSLRDRGFAGVEWEPIVLEPGDPAAAVAASMTAAVPEIETDRLLALVAGVLGRSPWCSVPAIRLYPQSARGRVLMRADVVVFDAAATLTSEAGRVAFAEGADPDEAGQRVWRAFADRIGAQGLPVAERQDRLRDALSAANMAFGGDRDELLAYALEGLGDDAAALARDLILLTRRDRDHGRTREDLEAALANEVHAPGGGLKGKLLSHGAWAPPPRPLGRREWGSDPSMGGGDALPDLAPVSRTSDRAETIARLGAVVEDEQVVDGTRLDALRELAALDDPAARAWRLRALGHSRIFLNAVHDAPLDEALPLFREIVLSRDDRRIAGALALLRRYGRDGLDGEAIWKAAPERSVTDAEVRLASLSRESVIERYGEMGDASVVDALVREIPEHADNPGWMGAACGLFRKVGAEAKAVRAILSLLAKPDHAGASYYAMRFFETVRCDEAVPYLRRGLEGEPVWRSGAARGLAAQGEGGRGEVLAWMQRRIAAPPDEARDNDVGDAVDVLAAKTPIPPALLDRAAAVGPRSLSSVERARKVAAPAFAVATSGGDAVLEESALVGPTREETADLRFRLWLSPGYASRRYRQSGHRDPAWDADVIEAHDAYSGAEPHPGAHPRIVDAYERAITKGCADGLVLYRSGACAQFRKDLALAERRLAAAVARIPAQYPGSPYLSSGATAVARFAQFAGRTEEALAWARKGAVCIAQDRGAPEFLASLELTAAMTAVAARLPDLAVGSAGPAAGRKHRHPITGLAVNGAAEPLVASADSGGFVQITIVEQQANRRALNPAHRARLHGDGRTVVAWATNDMLVSAGGDRRVKEIDASDPRAPVVTKEHAVDVPVTAIAPLGFLTIGLGDAAGRVFAIEADGRDAPRLIVQLRLGEIRRLIAWPGKDGFVAVDSEGRVAIVDGNGPRTLDLSVPVRAETVTFAPSGMLLCHGGGNEIFVNAQTGEVADAYPHEGNEPIVSRVAGPREFHAFEDGGVNVRAEPGAWYAGSEPLALAEAAWDRGVVVMATRAGWLRSTDFRG